MSKHIAPARIGEIATIVPAPDLAPAQAHAPTVVDRTFELPAALYAITVGAYLAFIALMAVTFGNPEAALPLVIIVVSIVAAFGVPAIWARMNPETASHSLGWYDFKRKGIQTLSGPLDAGSATVQVLVLPVLILGWGIAVAIIAATVR
ncbi:hypothetical protein [Novosphingobium lentum]|uniref:hypothetical protein n=1 Tax=Novosphingobium lentum TaxID=145287 RepID=UPI0008347FD3|nr:hypothetical protein [Novosphingobium lentum]